MPLLPYRHVVLLFLVSTALCSILAIAAESPRKWRDRSGKFEVEATLQDQSDTKVKLKKSDGTTIEVPIDRLSDADRQYLSKSSDTGPADNPFTAGVAASPQPATPRPRFPKTNQAAAASGAVLPDKGTEIPLTQGEPPQGLQFDPAPISRFADGGFPVSDIDAYDHVSTPVIVDHEKGLVAISIGRNIINRQDENRGRIYLGKLPAGPANLVWDVKEAVQLLDHDPESDRTLIMSGLDHFERGGDVVLLEGLGKGTPKELFRRKLPGMEKPGFKPQVGWAALVDGEYMIGQLDRRLYVWNLVTAQMVYAFDKVDSGKHPALSPGKRYMAVPNERGATIVNVIDGASLGFLVVGNVLTPEVAFHPDGKRIALCENNQLVVFDFVSGEETVNALFARPFGNRPIGWVGKDLFLTGLGDLIRTDLEMVLWNYAITGVMKSQGTPNGVLVASTNQKCGVASLPVPSPAAAKASVQLEKMGDSMMLVRPGAPVALAVEAPPGVDQEQVLRSLREAVERTGWKIVERSDTTIVANIGRGQPQQLQYNARGIGAAGAQETATITPFTAKLEIRRGTQVLWTRQTTNHVPSLLFLKNGETLQGAVSKYEKPDAEFFSRLQLPPRVPKPELAAGLGSSSVAGAAWKEAGTGPGAGPTNNRRTNRAAGKK